MVKLSFSAEIERKLHCRVPAYYWLLQKMDSAPHMQVLLGTVTNRMTINSCQAVPKSAHTSVHRWPTVHDTNPIRSIRAASNWLKTSNTHFAQIKNVAQPGHCMDWAREKYLADTRACQPPCCP
jgi:hypothetical protein